MVQHEYGWVRQIRGTLLDFCGKLDPNHFTHTNGFAWQSVRDTLVHIADCYVAWLGSFVLLKTKKTLTPREELLNLGLEDIIVRFEQVDSIVNDS
ncbi:DinB family protein [Bacillus sp. JJ1609]|uniref:DinB family protein n=1 Tax=Bacillus sp. JJ1609 TaxID=3122977 RepID=UPI002FFE8457